MKRHRGLLILAVALGVVTFSTNNLTSAAKQANIDEKTIEELADEVIRGDWGNNPDRKEDMIAAGLPYEEVQARVNEKLDVYAIHEPVAAEEVTESEVNHYESYTTAEYSLSDLQYHGVIYWGGYKWTYYSQQVLPGTGLNIPGRHVSSSGYVCDGDGYIVLAAPSSWGNVKGTVYPTPFGAPGKVYDVNAGGDSLDVYTR